MSSDFAFPAQTKTANVSFKSHCKTSLGLYWFMSLEPGTLGLRNLRRKTVFTRLQASNLGVVLSDDGDSSVDHGLDDLCTGKRGKCVCVMIRTGSRLDVINGTSSSS